MKKTSKNQELVNLFNSTYKPGDRVQVLQDENASEVFIDTIHYEAALCEGNPVVYLRESGFFDISLIRGKAPAGAIDKHSHDLLKNIAEIMGRGMDAQDKYRLILDTEKRCVYFKQWGFISNKEILAMYDVLRDLRSIKTRHVVRPEGENVVIEIFLEQ